MKDGKIRNIVLLVFMLAGFMCAQDVLVLNPGTGTQETMLNQQIIDDTTANGFLPNRVYELKRDSVYLVNSTLQFVQPGETLRLRASEGSGKLPIIYLWETGTGANPTQPPGYFIRTKGGTLEITNIAVAGFYEPVPENLDLVQGGLFRNDNAGASFIFDGCIFSNINGQMLRTNQGTAKVSITNCIFANLGALTTSNLGAGKGLDLREKECDSLIVENNTFVNYQDRVIRHYNFSNPTDTTGQIHYGRINHNTIINGMGYHGLISLSNVGAEMIITNNLFVDAFGLGEDSTDVTRAAEWANTGETYGNGNNKITWIFSTPNEWTNWTVCNNYFMISDSGQKFLDDFNFGPAPQLSDHIMGKLGAAAADAFTQADVNLGNIPRMMTNFMRWYEADSLAGGAGKTKYTTNFNSALHDMDRRVIEYYRDSLDAGYDDDSPAATGSTDGGQVGDLNWDLNPVSALRGTDNQRPSSFVLGQNYPNPFNPSTSIDFAITVNEKVTLEVFNIAGQKVSTLVNKTLTPGQYTADWNAASYSSGVYFYKLSQGTASSTKKMILIK